ncbi:MAG: hypothetical protein AAF654_06445 [Myxococcota bacterium]
MAALAQIVDELSLRTDALNDLMQASRNLEIRHYVAVASQRGHEAVERYIAAGGDLTDTVFVAEWRRFTSAVEICRAEVL